MIGCKKFTFIFWQFVFLCHLLKCAPNPKWLGHQSIIQNIKYEIILLKNGYHTHHKQKFMLFFQNMTMWLKTFKYTCHDSFLFWFENLHKCERNMKGNIWSFFLKKKSLDLQKIENHVRTFSYWFLFGNNFFKKMFR